MLFRCFRFFWTSVSRNITYQVFVLSQVCASRFLLLLCIHVFEILSLLLICFFPYFLLFLLRLSKTSICLFRRPHYLVCSPVLSLTSLGSLTSNGLLPVGFWFVLMLINLLCTCSLGFVRYKKLIFFHVYTSESYGKTLFTVILLMFFFVVL